MVDLKKYKWPFITIVVVVAVLFIIITVGYNLGILSEDPDGLERSIIDATGEEYLEGLPSVWNPFLSWIENEYVAGIIGIVLTFSILIGALYLIVYVKKRIRSKE